MNLIVDEEGNIFDRDWLNKYDPNKPEHKKILKKELKKKHLYVDNLRIQIDRLNYFLDDSRRDQLIWCENCPFFVCKNRNRCCNVLHIYTDRMTTCLFFYLPKKALKRYLKEKKKDIKEGLENLKKIDQRLDEVFVHGI